MRDYKDIIVNFDIDGLIAKVSDGNYRYAEPYKESIEQVNRVYDLGCKVEIATARYGERFPGSQYQVGYEETICWLRDNGVKFHKLIMGKPSADIYVDDKGCLVRGENGNKDWEENFWPMLEEVRTRNRYGRKLEAK